MKFTKYISIRLAWSLLLPSFLISTANVAFAQLPPEVPVEVAIPEVVLVTTEKPGMKWTGDIRYRFDFRDYELEKQEKKSVERLRLRYGFTQSVNENAQIEVRLASGPGRTTTNQTLGANTESSSNYEIRIDRAAMIYKFNDENKLTLGRMANPFYLVGSNDMAWDADLNFDGLVYKFTNSSPTVETSLSLSHLILKESSSTADPVGLDSAQLSTQFKIDKTQSLGVSLSYLQYTGINNHAGLASTTSLNGNTGVDCGTYLTYMCYTENFRISEIGLEYGFPVLDKKMTLFVDYQTNGAVSENNNAYIVGLKWNRLKNAGDIAFNYDYRRLEKDSSLGAFTDAESFNGGTNGEGHRAWLGYQIEDNLNLGFTAFLGQSFIASGESSRKRTRYIVDLAMNF